MFTAVISFFLSILSFNFLQQLPPFITIVYGIAILFALIIILSYCFASKKYATTKRHEIRFGINLPLALGFFIFGFIWVWLHANYIIDKWIPPAIEGKIIEVIGTIDSIPNAQKETVYFDFEVQQVAPSSYWPNPGRIKAHWYLPPELRVGEVWQLSVRIRKPRAYSNPGSFDLEKYFFQKALVAEGTVVETIACKKIKNATIRYGIDHFRAWLKNKINSALVDQDFSGIVCALVVGLQDHISPKQWEVFRKTGTAHLVAISGLHVGLIAGCVFFVMRVFSKFMPVALFKIPIPITCAIGSLIAAMTYAMLAGFSMPTRRALLMIIFLMFSLLQKRVHSKFRGYLNALLVVLILDPLSILNVGFWLSFGAVALILYGTNGRLNPKGLWWCWGRTQWLVSFGLAPLTLGFFNATSLISPLANFIAIPWISLITVPFSLIGSACIIFSTSLGTFFLKAANYSLAVLWPLLEKLSHISKATFESGVFNLFNLAIIMIGIILLLTPRGFPAKYIGFIWLLPIFFTKPAPVEKNTAKITVLDVGQGLSAIVETQNHVLIFDAGPKLSDNFDAGERVVVPYLATRDIKKIDTLVISHRDNDHAGGANSILQKLLVKKIISSEKLFLDQNLELCFAGQRWEWDGVLFEILHPSEQFIFHQKRNERSCVLRVQAGEQSVLFTADIGASSEKLLIKKMSEKLASTVMLVPHHGSLNSSTIEFIRLVSPKYAIIPVGYLNSYGHPKQEVVRRYQRENIIVFDTVKEGAISFILNSKPTLTISDRYRTDQKKYWHTNF